MKTIEDFEGNVLRIYDEMEAVVEKLADVSPAELMCVLTAMLSRVAKEAGITPQEILGVLEIKLISSGSTFHDPRTIH